MHSTILELRQLADTEKLGRLLGELASPGEVICLDGDLGAGKTTLTQAIARGAGVPTDCYVTSPSFAILHEYQGRLPLYHMDFYRLHGEADALDLGFDEYFYLAGLTVIEWSKRAEKILPQERLTIELELCGDRQHRTAKITATDALTEKLRRLEKAFSA